MIKHGESWSRTESNSPNNISWNLVQSIDPQLSFLKKLTLDYTTIVLTSLAPYQERKQTAQWKPRLNKALQTLLQQKKECKAARKALLKAG